MLTCAIILLGNQIGAVLACSPTFTPQQCDTLFFAEVRPAYERLYQLDSEQVIGLTFRCAEFDHLPVLGETMGVDT